MPSPTRYRVKAPAELRAEPDRSARVLTELAEGTVVARTGKKERRWVPVTHEGRTGWIAERHLEKVAQEPLPDAWDGNDSDIVAIIRDAARRHLQPEEDLLRVGRCESNLDPRAVNPAGPYFGLFQFLRSTWATTPYAERDIFDPIANANAAAWMWQQGRRNEWACQ
jgi:hypothetical protein